MDASRFVGLALICLSSVALSNQAVTDESSDFLCPLEDRPTTVNHTLVHNITRTVKCVNGRNMYGCCVQRIYCDYNTSHIDLALYGPPGYRMTCEDICCPQKYILPIPLPNINETTNNRKLLSNKDDIDSMDVDDNVVDSDSNSDEQ